MFHLLPGITRALRVRIIANGNELVDDFLVDLPIVDHRPGDEWRAQVELVESRAYLRRWEIRRSLLGKLLAMARKPRKVAVPGLAEGDQK